MTLPPIAPAVLADVLDALPPRLRKRVDASLDRTTTWAVTATSTVATADLDEDTSLTWALRSGVLTTADDLTCTCLLAPKCLHRGLAVAAADIADPVGTTDPGEPTGSAGPAGSADVTSQTDNPLTPAAQRAEGNAPDPARTSTIAAGAEGVGPEQRAAASGLWAACATVLRAGAGGSGAIVRAEVLRAVHSARVVGLHRAAAGGLRVAAGLAAARSGDSSFDRDALAAELVDLMLLCHNLRAGTGTADIAELRGTARREYRPIGALRLYGLCTETVVADTGYAGVVTHLVDDSGALWTVPAIMPGDAGRVPAAANGPVAIGESGLSQRALGRAGMLLSGGTASPDSRLGAGKAVRAVAAKGATWAAEPLARLWAQPLADQVSRAFDAGAHPSTHRPAGADLLFLDATVLGHAGPALRVAVGQPGLEPLGGNDVVAQADDTAAQPAVVDLVGDSERARENLRVLAAAPGLRVRVVARLLTDRPGTAVAVAVAGDPADLDLPEEFRHHLDLGLDRLQSSHVRPGPARELAPRAAHPDRLPALLRPLETMLHRITLGGRPVAALATTAHEVAALSRAGLATTATLLADLTTTARHHPRDAFGRVLPDTTDAFPTAWLRAGLHLREFTRATGQRTWLSRAPAP